MFLASNLASNLGIQMKIDLSTNLVEDLNQNTFATFSSRNALIELGGKHNKLVAQYEMVQAIFEIFNLLSERKKRFRSN